MVYAGICSQMSVVVATVLAILAFITSCFYSTLNSAKNNMSTAYFECITFWAFEAGRSKKQEDAENEYTENAGRLLRRANWCACLYKDNCIIVRWWFRSVILIFLLFLVIMAASTFSQTSPSKYLTFGFWILLVLSIIFSIISIAMAIIATVIIKHPYKSNKDRVELPCISKVEHPRTLYLLNWGIFWGRILPKIFDPNLADDKFREFRKEICEIEKLDKGILKYPQWFEDNKTKCKEL